MPGYCEPWPGNMKTTGDAATTSDLPSRSVSREDGRGPAAIVAIDGDGAPIAERAPPDVQRERHVGEVLLLVSAEVLAESPRRGVERRLALGREREEHRASGRRSVVSCGGASSTTACAFVPPTPNELTAARRGEPLRDHGSSVVVT